jgi:hypothetical protein
MGPITRALLVVSVVFATFQVGTMVRAQQATQAPAYRSSIALVPIDVRVIDNKTGRPVTDLKRDDFTIFEDDARQEIRHFLLQRFDDGRDEPGAVAVSTPARLVPVVSIPPLSLAPQASRIFLIVLAHGRHEVPSKGLTALLAFLRTQLLPRDQVALLAYDRQHGTGAAYDLGRRHRGAHGPVEPRPYPERATTRRSLRREPLRG